MPIKVQMPALSPTMEFGTLAKWMVKEGDTVVSGDLLAEIETDKATMEFEAVDEGVIEKILITAGTENVKVGEVIALIRSEEEELPAAAIVVPEPIAPQAAAVAVAPKQTSATVTPQQFASSRDDRIKASPLARRLAAAQGLDLASVTGSGPNGRIVKADIGNAKPAVGQSNAAFPIASVSSLIPAAPVITATSQDFGIPHQVVKLSGMRKTIARRLTESKQQIPHIYLTVDIRLDALLKLRGELNASLESRGVKLSVNDLLIKALGVALQQVPECNVQFAGDEMLQFSRADVSVAVSIPSGLITPIVADAGNKSVSAISTEMKDLAERAKAGKLAPNEYQGGTASISNMGMMGIKQFEAVINPPQAMIMAIGAGEKRPYIIEDALGMATVMCATGSFDHRAIDGADGARLMSVFKELIERPLGLLA
jgi:pyruvate dehydrogenase E2 component (dihydrolipoamide acetyltransferase)